MKTVQLMAVVALCAAACSGVVPVPTNSLGITDFRITETSTGVHIVGVNAQQAKVGELTLTLGEFDDPDYGRVHGRILSVGVGEKLSTHQSEGTPALNLPLFPKAEDEDFNSFLLDPHVLSVMAKWGVAFTRETAVAAAGDELDGERPYDTCSPSPTAACQASECWGTSYWDQTDQLYGQFQQVCCPGNQTAATRTCTPGYTNNDCGHAGPAGCSVCWNQCVSWCHIDSYGNIFYGGPCP